MRGLQSHPCGVDDDDASARGKKTLVRSTESCKMQRGIMQTTLNFKMDDCHSQCLMDSTDPQHQRTTEKNATSCLMKALMTAALHHEICTMNGNQKKKPNELKSNVDTLSTRNHCHLKWTQLPLMNHPVLLHVQGDHCAVFNLAVETGAAVITPKNWTVFVAP